MSADQEFAIYEQKFQKTSKTATGLKPRQPLASAGAASLQQASHPTAAGAAAAPVLPASRNAPPPAPRALAPVASSAYCGDAGAGGSYAATAGGYGHSEVADAGAAAQGSLRLLKQYVYLARLVLDACFSQQVLVLAVLKRRILKKYACSLFSFLFFMIFFCLHMFLISRVSSLSHVFDLSIQSTSS